MDIKVDSKKKIVVVRRDGVVVKNLKFDGKLIAGAGASFLGNVSVKEAYFGKGCLINGVVEAEKVVIGANSSFNALVCGSALILNGCRGNMVKARGDVRIGNSNIKVVESEGTVFVDGSAKLGKLAASKVVAKSNALFKSEVLKDDKSES
ncbi:MAG: hypothetical protein DSY33_03750 [Archaeoglobus sp.]|nr:MAG: hypothetical protein DSY33_03750 [Archaeoglobus sp.]